MTETNLISFLLLDARDGERVVQVKNVKCGERFRVGGQSYKKIKTVTGTGYDYQRHTMSLFEYNCVTEIAGEYESHEYYDPNFWVIACSGIPTTRGSRKKNK